MRGNISECLQNHKHVLIRKQQLKTASDLEGKVVMKEGTAFHSLKDKEQKAFERKRTATNSALFWTDADFSMQHDADRTAASLELSFNTCTAVCFGLF